MQSKRNTTTKITKAWQAPLSAQLSLLSRQQMNSPVRQKHELAKCPGTKPFLLKLCLDTVHVCRTKRDFLSCFLPRSLRLCLIHHNILVTKLESFQHLLDLVDLLASCIQLVQRGHEGLLSTHQVRSSSSTRKEDFASLAVSFSSSSSKSFNVARCSVRRPAASFVAQFATFVFFA